MVQRTTKQELQDIREEIELLRSEVVVRIVVDRLNCIVMN